MINVISASINPEGLVYAIIRYIDQSGVEQTTKFFVPLRHKTVPNHEVIKESFISHQIHLLNLSIEYWNKIKDNEGV